MKTAPGGVRLRERVATRSWLRWKREVMVSGEPVEISEVREAIDEVDDRILALLRQRYDLAVRAHEIRSRVGAGRNETRENEVVSRVRFRGGYPVEIVERIWRALFDGSPTKPGSPE